VVKEIAQVDPWTVWTLNEPRVLAKYTVEATLGMKILRALKRGRKRDKLKTDL
jgi:hypothetical protein